MAPYNIAASLDQMTWKKEKDIPVQAPNPYSIEASLNRMTWKTGISPRPAKRLRSLTLDPLPPIKRSRSLIANFSNPSQDLPALPASSSTPSQDLDAPRPNSPTQSSDRESTNPPDSRRKGKVVTGKPRIPSKGFMIYQTDRYKPYAPQTSIGRVAASGKFRKFEQYDDYHLFTDPNESIDIDSIPKIGVRLDDFTVARVLTENFSPKELNVYWPAEFDQHGMVRTTRVPLGYAEKVWVNAGGKDMNGEEVGVAEAGWYYCWWRGLHLLCGKEGLDAGIYRIRPSFEEFTAPGLSWKKGTRAVLQQASGIELL